MNVHKYLFLCQIPITTGIQSLFTEIFHDINDLFNYVTKEVTKTDTFHIIIPLEYLSELINDPIFEFDQVKRIDVYYNNGNYVRRLQNRSRFQSEKLNFFTARELLRQLESSVFVQTLALSTSNRSEINAFITSTTNRLTDKTQDTANLRSKILRRCAMTQLYGLPAKNINELPESLICVSCNFICKTPYMSECKHHYCEACATIRKK